MTEDTRFKQVGAHINLHEALAALEIEMVMLASSGEGMHPRLDNIRTYVMTNSQYALEQNPADGPSTRFNQESNTLVRTYGPYTYRDMSYELAREWEHVFKLYLLRAGFTLMAEREGEWQTERLEIRKKELKELGKF